MFSKYEIRNVNGEDILYLFPSYEYHFSEEFADGDYQLLSHQFLNQNHIPFSGNKVYFVVDGMVVKKVELPSHKEYFYDPDHFLLNLQLEDQSFIELSLRDYLMSILFYYYHEELGDEVYKCICILFNTYAYKKMKEDGFLVSHTAFADFKPISEYETITSYSKIYNRFKTIIDECSCMFLSYQKDYILPFIHYSNSGKTLSNIKYPYLSSVKSLWDLTADTYLSIKNYDFASLSSIFKVKLESNSMIQILNHGHSIKMKYKVFSIREIMDLLHLPSNDLSIIVNKEGMTFINKGMGNGLGLSITGSYHIEKNGGNYQNILNYYFPKCGLYKNIKELSN